MSLSTTAAARQNGMNASMAVVAMSTRGGPAVWGAAFIQSVRRRLSPEKKKATDAERSMAYWRGALPLRPAGLADGLGLGSVLWQVPIRPGVLGSPAPGASRRASAPMKVTKLS